MENMYTPGGGVGGESMSTLSTEEKNMVIMSSEESSSYLDESELELGLGLSLGGGGKAKIKAAVAITGGGGCRDHYARRVLTAKDFPSLLSDKGSSSSSSSNSNNNGGSCGTKRTADGPSSPPRRSGVSQVVGWPPVKTYRMNSLANNAKLPGTEDFVSTDDKSKIKNIFADNMNDANKTSSYVKVNMDGIPIGRKVDLVAHICYETLARTLDDMFRPSAAVGWRGLNIEEQVIVAGPKRPIRLLDGLSEFVLTYEDKEGDLMLVGDVPWEMFISSVRRLRIMRTAEANGLSEIP